MVENIKIYINEVDYTEYAIIENFEIDLRERDYGASVSFFLPYSQLDKIIPSVELKILDGEKLIFAGIVTEIQFKERTKEKILVNVNCGNFNIIPTRRTISGIIDPEDYAGDLVRRYIEKFLHEEGITEGIIEQGIQLYETEYYDWDTLSIAEILNNLADASGFEWYIDMRKQLHFGKLNPSPTHHTSEETRLIPQNRNFWDLEINKSLQNYRNKVFVIGGEPIEEVPEENLNFDYLLKVFVQNDNEIQKMAELNNDSGVWGYVVNDPNIVTLEDAIKKANSELEKYGQIPVNINVRTKIDYFSVGDTINVDLPLYGINNSTFIIESIRIEFFGKDLIYNLQLTNKTAQAGQKEDLYKFIEKMVKEIKRNNRTIQIITKEKGGGEPDYMIPRDNLLCWVDMQENDNLLLYPDNEGTLIVDNVYNKKDNSTLCFSDYGLTNKPRLKELNGFNWMSFDIGFTGIFFEDNTKVASNNSIYFLDYLHNGETFFIVYNDRTKQIGQTLTTQAERHNGQYLEIYKYIIEMPGLSCPLGYPYYGDSNNDNLFDVNGDVSFDDTELYINGVKVSIQNQKRIRHTPVVMCLKRPLSFYNKIRGFGTNSQGDYVNWILNRELIRDEWGNVTTMIDTYTGKNNAFVGDIAEIIVYDTLLSQDKIDTINRYLMQKYNIS